MLDYSSKSSINNRFGINSFENNYNISNPKESAIIIKDNNNEYEDIYTERIEHVSLIDYNSTHNLEEEEAYNEHKQIIKENKLKQNSYNTEFNIDNFIKQRMEEFNENNDQFINEIPYKDTFIPFINSNDIKEPNLKNKTLSFQVTSKAIDIDKSSILNGNKSSIYKVEDYNNKVNDNEIEYIKNLLSKTKSDIDNFNNEFI